MEEIIEKDEASRERERQRSESEARDIIHDIEKLYSFPEEKKTRWIWELLQNAKDVATADGVDIHIKLTSDSIEFKHNGQPFRTKHLLAILYKTSTKSLNGEGGTTGKYGTGFVTTHILNKKLTISGVHENENGKRRFTIEIDRSSASLDENKALTAMQDSLASSFKAISEITKKPSEIIEDNWHTLTYKLKPDSYNYAKNGLLELQRNLAFTLLINNPKIRSVVIESLDGLRSFSATEEHTPIEGIHFVSLGSDMGLLYQKLEKLTFGIPAKKKGDGFEILPIERQAVLFKEFPLIGTEGFNLPIFIQHEDFHPTEQRDAIRTKISSEGEKDPTAEKNREALIEFVESYIPFMEKLIDAKLPGIYLFAKSGLPELIDIYSNRDWFEDNIQKQIRNNILQKAIVTTCSGISKTIAESKFILKNLEDNNAFFSLAAKLIPGQIPRESSIWHWAEIIEQDLSLWPDNIILQIEDLLKLVPEKLTLDNDSAFAWLKELYQFLGNNRLTHLGEKYHIYPNEAGEFCLRDEVSIHPEIDEEFKLVSRSLGRPLEKEFLNRKVGSLTTIKPFDVSEFFNHLNKNLISELKIETATEVETKAIFHICCLFRSDKAFRRESWFKIINQLLPELASHKKIISVEYENYWRSAENWTIKYICYLIEKTGKPTIFAERYFENNIDLCFQWLNEFLAFAFSLQEDTRESILKRRIIPTQSDEFKPYDDSIFAEQDSKYFDDIIKDIYKTYTQKGDPRKFIIDTRVLFEGVRQKEVDILTKEIDKLFHDPIESKIKKGGELNEMFLQLNDWFERFSTSSTLLPTFSSKRHFLYVLALGEGFGKQIMELRSAGKSIDDLTELAKIELTTQQMKMFQSIAVELGTDKLMAKAQEMLDAKRQIERWKTIGRVAEVAFKEALSYTEPTFEIQNPDIGKDFIIIANGKEYGIEIKSVELLKGNVNMSLLQGKTAVMEKDRYSLCVLTRPDDDRPVDKDYFIQESRFVPDIGYKIGDSIDRWTEGLKNLDTNTDVKVTFDDKTESVYISRSIWNVGVSFNDLISILNNYFST